MLLATPATEAETGAPAEVGPGPGFSVGGRCAAGAVPLRPGTDLAAAVSRAAEGTPFCILAGEHRLQAIIPRNRQSFQGEPGAVLNGARRLSGFTRDGARWFAPTQLPRLAVRTEVPCEPDRPRCGYPITVFIDDAPLRHAGSLGRLRSGEFFLDETSGRLYLADDPGARRIELTERPYAFLGGASGVSIRGLVVEKYATSVQAGAIGYNRPSPGWTIEGNEVRLNATIEIVAGSGSHVLTNRIQHNGQMGAGCVGEDILFERNEIAENGHFSGVEVDWEVGGAKCAVTNRLQVRRNLVRRNSGTGFWTDIDNINSLYEQNRIEENRRSGISHEISYAAVIRYNTLLHNGDEMSTWLWGAGILVQNSRDVQVYGNAIITRRGNGIALIQQDRGHGAHGLYRTTGNHVHDNLIVATRPDQGAWGALADHDLAGMRTGGNRFDRNTYQVPSGEDDRWAWVDGFYSWREFRTRSGQERDGVLVVRPPGTFP